GDRLRVRVDQQLRGIEAIAVRRIVWAMNAIAVKLTGPNVRQVAMPDLIGALTEIDLVRFDCVVLMTEQTELDSSRVLGKEGEVHALAVPGRTEGIGLAWPYAHLWFSVERLVVVEQLGRCFKQEADPTMRNPRAIRYASARIARL